MLATSNRTDNLLSKSVGKEHAQPMHVGKRTLAGHFAPPARGCWGWVQWRPVPLMKQAYQLHQFKSQLRKM